MRLPSRLEDARKSCAITCILFRQSPYQLSGCSFGGLVAFEMARQLTAAGEQVPLLALFSSYLIDTRGPKRALRLRFRTHVQIGRRYQPAGRLPRLLLFDATDRSPDGAGPFAPWEELAAPIERTRSPAITPPCCVRPTSILW
jgi:thioesterase domain-containing protein